MLSSFLPRLYYVNQYITESDGSTVNDFGPVIKTFISFIDISFFRVSLTKLLLFIELCKSCDSFCSFLIQKSALTFLVNALLG